MASFLWQIPVLRKRLAASIRKRGWIASGKLAFQVLKSLVWLDRTMLKFHFVTRNVYHLERPLPNIECREVTPEDYDELLRCSVHFDRQEMFRRFALDHKCVIGRTKDRIVSYGWIGRNEFFIPVLGKHVSLDADTAYFYDGYVVDEYRGGRIFAATLSCVSDLCQELDLTYGFALANIKRPVRAFVRLLGADSISVVRCGRILGYRICSEREVSFQKAVALSKRTLRQ